MKSQAPLAIASDSRWLHEASITESPPDRSSRARVFRTPGFPSLGPRRAARVYRGSGATSGMAGRGAPPAKTGTPPPARPPARAATAQRPRTPLGLVLVRCMSHLLRGRRRGLLLATKPLGHVLDRTHLRLGSRLLEAKTPKSPGRAAPKSAGGAAALAGSPGWLWRRWSGLRW